MTIINKLLGPHRARKLHHHPKTMPIFTAASTPGSIAALSFLFSTTSSSSSSSVHYSSMLAPTNANSRIAHTSRHSVLAGKVSLSDNPKPEKPNQSVTTTAAPVAGSTGAAEDTPDSVWQDRIYADWKAARVYLDTGCIYQGRVEGHNGGGFRIRFYSLLGFLPFPQLSPSHSCKAPQKTIHEIAKGLAGSLISMKVIQVEEESRKLIFSEKEAAWSRFSKSINVGDVFSGMVGAVEDFGAFVHLRLPDGLYHLTGLVHVSEVSWDIVQDVRDILREDDEVRVKVINVDRQKSRINLSIKQLEEDPLLETLEKVIPQDGSVGPDTLRTGDSTIIDPLPGLEAIFQELLRENGIDDVRISRQGFEKRVVSQDLQLWLSNAPPTNKKFTLLARAGRQVQEIQLTTTLDQEGIKKALQRALERVP